MRNLLVTAASAMAVSACVPVPYATPGGGACLNGQGQSYIGQTASFEVGQKILAETKAKTFRWAGPDKMMTMELDPNRVTVYYDAAGTITKVACG